MTHLLRRYDGHPVPSPTGCTFPAAAPIASRAGSIALPVWLPALVALASFGTAAWLSGRTDVTGVDSQLALLLRFMAALKALAVLGMAGVATWRLRMPIGSLAAAGYLAGLTLMAAAPGLIWSLAHIALGAVCFHAGLFAVLICALRDDGVDWRRNPARGSRR